MGQSSRNPAILDGPVGGLSYENPGLPVSRGRASQPTNLTETHGPAATTGAHGAINFWALYGFLLEGWSRFPADHHLASSGVEPGGGFPGEQSVEQPRLRQRAGKLA